MYPIDSTGRDARLDIARGIAILLVVVGHAMDGAQNLAGWNRPMTALLVFIYTFHVASFFAVSGFLSRSLMERSWPEFMRILGVRIVWPYALWGTILMGIHFGLSQYTNTKLLSFAPWTLLWKPASVTWFLYALFLAMILLKALTGRPVWIILATGVGLVVASYTIPSPLYLRFIGVFVLASQLDQTLLDRLLTRNMLRICGITMLGTAAFAWQNAAMSTTGFPGLKFVFLPALFAGPLLLLGLCDWMERRQVSRKICAILALLGRRSMPIFLTHILFTAGARITLTALGIESISLVILLGVTAGVGIPLAASEIARRTRVSVILGWR
ncbi:acyltransferase family protein [Sulfitobacter sp. SK012]|uniref:acyltransferase family protein n=1 Tax=Sulfitobacter sp. SK012 TaxID=1389005 RepID=UPI0013B3AAA9|nr:acyltransferase family protein [Sulfitobacter sp. SK012]